jgi:hypothetical protein
VKYRVLNAAELEKLVLKYRRQLEKTNGTGGDRLARLGSRIERKIVAEITAGQGPVTDEQLAQFQSALRRVIAQGNPEFLRTMEQHVPDVWANSVDRFVSVSALSPFDTRTVDRIVDVADQFERAIEDKSILRTSGGYTERWRNEWTDEWTRTARQVQARFTRATITGDSWTEVAKSLTDDLGSLKIQGRISTDDFARAFTRTKFTELGADAGIALGREAGLELFISVGVPDDRQSQICWEASRQGPHPLEWWESSTYGVPPRHVLNCRCSLLAVPAETKWEGQDNPKFAQAREEVTV